MTDNTKQFTTRIAIVNDAANVTINFTALSDIHNDVPTECPNCGAERTVHRHLTKSELRDYDNVQSIPTLAFACGLAFNAFIKAMSPPLQVSISPCLRKRIN